MSIWASSCRGSSPSTYAGAFFPFAFSKTIRITGENTQAIPTTMNTQEIGRVKKVAAVPEYWKDFNILLSKVGPRIKARVNR